MRNCHECPHSESPVGTFRAGPIILQRECESGVLSWPASKARLPLERRCDACPKRAQAACSTEMEVDPGNCSTQRAPISMLGV